MPQTQERGCLSRSRFGGNALSTALRPGRLRSFRQARYIQGQWQDLPLLQRVPACACNLRNTPPCWTYYSSPEDFGADVKE